MGTRQPPDQRGALRPAPRPPGRVLRGQATCTPRTASSARPRRIAARCGCTPRRPGPASSPATCSAGRRRPSSRDFAPNFTIICVPSFKADPETEGTRTGTAILVHLERMEIIIVGTEYAGEIKKGAFTVMNYLMPDEGVLPMHSRDQRRRRTATRRSSSACRGPARRRCRPIRCAASSATTSTAGAMAGLQLRGRLLRQDDPPLADVRARHLPDDPPLRDRSSRTSTSTRATRALDLDSERFTENTRGAYPLDFIGNADETGHGGPAAARRLPDGRRVRRPAADRRS